LLYLLMALIWLSLAMVAFTAPGNWSIPRTDMSVGWLALLFFAYNVIRWSVRRTGIISRSSLLSRPASSAEQKTGSGADVSDPPALP
jgi:hypothetical protein